MNFDTVTSNPYVAALAGAILGLRAIPGGTTVQRVTNLLFGFLLAVFVGPALVEYQHITSLRLAAGLIFAVGAGGLVAFAAIIDGVRETKFAAILTGWLSRNKGA